ncbi:MAG: hypothetical protein MUC63_10865, partial [Planctomycetes bacterium]|nr:hypothetical protein [Planctomycetota bacterium]
GVFVVKKVLGKQLFKDRVPMKFQIIKRALPATEARNARFQVSGSRLQVQEKVLSRWRRRRPMG